MKLQLHKPIAFFDLETTGTNISTDRIVEVAIIKINTDGTKTIKRKLINPQMPIPAGATDIHGITDDMVKDAPTFKQAANELKQFIEGCDIGGFNSNRFDLPLLVEEFLRAGIDFTLDGRRLIDAQRIFHTMEQRTLGAAYKFYCDKELENAHSAEADAMASWDVFVAQVEKYPVLGNSVDSVCEFLGDENIVDFARRIVMENGVEVYNFGKHKGKSVAEVHKNEPSYYDWIMKGDFAMHTKQKLTEIITRSVLKKTKA